MPYVFICNAYQKCEEPINYNVRHFRHHFPPSKYNILHINIDSLRNKLDDLELFLHDRLDDGIEIHILAVTQIKIFGEVIKYHNLPDYNSHFSTNPTGAGGVALFIHKSLVSGVVENLEDVDKNMNCLIANIPALNINVGVVYKDPNTATESLVNYFDKILIPNQRTIFVGNMNVNLLAPNRLTTPYTDVVRKHGFVILNKIERDFTTSATTAEYSINDHVLANVKKFKYSLALCDADISDNRITFVGIDDNKPDRIPFLTEPNGITYQRINYPQFNRHFSRINLRKIYSIDSLILQLDRCKSKSLETRNLYRTGRDRSWINDRSLGKLDRLRMRSEANALAINASQSDSRRLWNTINGCLTNKPSFRKHSIDAIQNQTGQLVIDKKQIADIFNRYFLNIGLTLYNRIPHVNNCRMPEVDFNEYYIGHIQTDAQEVYELIQAMKKANCLHVNIPSDILKYHSRKLARVLARLFNRCFDTGEFPGLLKIDRVSPAFKSKDPLEPENYRPISVPPNLSKIMELIIARRIKNFCHENQILDENQFGFQKNSCAMSAVISVVDYLQCGLNERPDAIGACLFIDLKKASNTIPHHSLMEKLHRIGIRGFLHDLINDYLSERQQFVCIDNVLSDNVHNQHAFSIPQGSALGPLFFLLYINDIFKLKLHGKVILFADDTAIVYVESDPETLKRHMRSDLKLLNKWFSVNFLTMNIAKTKAMIFNAGHRKVELNLNVRDQQIEIVQTHKYLGIELQDTLKWDAQINKIIREINAVAVAARKIGYQIDRNVSFSMYQKFVYNRLACMASVFGNEASKRQLKSLQVAQDMAIKSFYSGEYYEDISEIYAQYRLPNVKQIIEYDSVLLIYKLENNCLKLNRTVQDINGTNVLSAATRRFQSLDPWIQNQRELGQFKRKFKQSCFKW